MEVVLGLIAVLLALLVAYILKLKSTIKMMSINPNFGVTTRIAALSIIEQRKNNKDLAVVAFDVAGMGLANSAHGEQWVNARIKDALEAVRQTLRATDMVAQLNSGDEFFVVVRAGDEDRVMAKVSEAFATYWPGGIYVATGLVEKDIMSAVIATMEKVYSIKAIVKGKKAA